MPQKGEVVIGLHLYQPPRRAYHQQLSSWPTDPEGVDWTARIHHECYRPLLEKGVFKQASFDLQGTLHRELEKLDSASARRLAGALRDRGVGEPYLHPILPDLSYDDKRILIRFGAYRFHKKSGEYPKIFWPPETALDTETLSVLVENGYRGVLCAPEQIRRADGQPSDNQPTRIQLPGGKVIIALPFDRPISQELAFDPKKNVDLFINQHILPALSRVSNGNLLAWTDGETFGHHSPFADHFLQYLLSHGLPGAGLTPVSVNELIRSLAQPGEGKLVERTAWSCPHGDLLRWHGACSCCGSGDLSWKRPFFDGFAAYNLFVTKLVQAQLGSRYIELLANDFEFYLENPGGSQSRADHSLLSAKAAALAARTSCGTYYGSPHTSGRINALMALQSIQHLMDAGMERAAESGREILRHHLRKKKNSFGDQSELNPFNEILR